MKTTFGAITISLMLYLTVATGILAAGKEGKGKTNNDIGVNSSDGRGVSLGPVSERAQSPHEKGETHGP